MLVSLSAERRLDLLDVALSDEPCRLTSSIEDGWFRRGGKVGGTWDECAEGPESESESSENGLDISIRGISTLLACRGGSGGEAVRLTKLSSEWLVGCKSERTRRGV